MRFQVVVTDWDFGSTDVEREELSRVGAELTAARCRTEDDVIAVAREADGLLVQWAPITRRVLQCLPRCRAVCRAGTGYDNIDVPAATEYGILVGYVPDYCRDEVSTQAMALLLATIRKVILLDHATRHGGWRFLARGRPIYCTAGRTLGIVGLGRIGRMLVPKARGFGWRLLVADPYVDRDTVASFGAEQVALEELLRESDYVTLHCPLTAETRHLIGERELRLMKPTAILVNTARGPVVDNTALHRALSEGWIAGAGLDVLEDEPLPEGHPLLALPNATFSPHAAYYSEESLVDVRRRTARFVAMALAGERPDGLLNPEVLEQGNRT